MNSIRRFGAVVTVMIALAASLPALRAEKNDSNERPPSTWAWAGETPEQRTARIGTIEDPGYDPDPNKKWIRFGQEYSIEKYEKRFAAFDQRPGWVRPMANVNIEAEIYREDEKYVWVWHGTKPPAEEEYATEMAAERAKISPERIKALLADRAEFSEISVEPANVSLSFVEAIDGLPQQGSWRNVAAVADMNLDGHLDIVTPPERGSGSKFYIFLGDGTGKWREWEIKAPGIAAYGSVAVGDLNGDKIPDLVFAMHLNGVRALLGDGKGKFVDASVGLPVNSFPTRRAVVADIDRDGDLDIVALTEAATPGGFVGGHDLRAYLNDGKAGKWTPLGITDPKRQLGGDWLAVGDFNADKRPDFVASSVVFSGTDLIHLSKGKTWESFGRGFLPFRSIYTDVDAAKFTSSKGDDAILAFRRSWPTPAGDRAGVAPPAQDMIAGIEIVSWRNGRASRTPIVRWFGAETAFGMAAGDFNGDKKADIVYSTWSPREFVVLLGDGKGGFKRATVEGPKPPSNTNYEITVADINRDGRDDLVVLYEANERTRNGSVRVYLSAPVAR